MSTYKYLPGSDNRREAVELDVTQNGQYITTCVVNVQMLLDGLEVFPCNSNIMDDVKLTPQQRLQILELVQAERKRITDSYPIKTCEGWNESGLPTFEDYCFPGDKVDEAMVDNFVDMLSPITLSASCVQVGEPYSHEQDIYGNYKPTYITFHRFGKDIWQFDGFCFKGENQNRVTGTSKIQQLIDETRKEREKRIIREDA